VKKKTENKGKWFYTCQKPRGKQCGFWMLEENAELREQAAVLNNSRTEPRSTAQAVESKHDLWGEPLKLASSPESTPPAYTSTTMQSDSGSKNADHQKRIAGFDVDGSDLDWPMTDEEANRAEREAILAVTPRKSVRIEAFTTPGGQGPSAYFGKGLPTPDTGGLGGNLFITANEFLSRKRKADNDFLDLVSPASTPTPIRFKDVEAFTTPGGQGPSAHLGKGLPTPDTGGLGGNLFVTANEFLSRERKADNVFLGLVSPASKLTPIRSRDIEATNLADGMFADITRAFEANNVNIEGEAMTAIRQTCARYDLRAQGISKG
jgi:hypothetical protein